MNIVRTAGEGNTDRFARSSLMTHEDAMAIVQAIQVVSVVMACIGVILSILVTVIAVKGKGK